MVYGDSRWIGEEKKQKIVERTGEPWNEAIAYMQCNNTRVAGNCSFIPLAGQCMKIQNAYFLQILKETTPMPYQAHLSQSGERESHSGAHSLENQDWEV